MAALNVKKLSNQLQQPQSIEQYNKEIKAALRNAKEGKSTSIEKLEKEMKKW